MTDTKSKPHEQTAEQQNMIDKIVQRRRILFIDDHVLVRESYETLLKNQGYDLVAVADGLKGLEALRKEEFDVVVCDVRMPGMSGVDFVKVAREVRREKKRDLPIIFLTAYVDPNLEAEAKALHPFAYLYKPAEDVEILEALKRCFQLLDKDNA